MKYKDVGQSFDPTIRQYPRLKELFKEQNQGLFRRPFNPSQAVEALKKNELFNLPRTVQLKQQKVERELESRGSDWLLDIDLDYNEPMVIEREKKKQKTIELEPINSSCRSGVGRSLNHHKVDCYQAKLRSRMPPKCQTYYSDDFQRLGLAKSSIVKLGTTASKMNFKTYLSDVMAKIKFQPEQIRKPIKNEEFVDKGSSLPKFLLKSLSIPPKKNRDVLKTLQNTSMLLPTDCSNVTGSTLCSSNIFRGRKPIETSSDLSRTFWINTL